MDNHIRTIFNQLLEIVPKNEFNKSVGQHNWDRYVKNFTFRQQFITILYSQATSKDSLRDIELWLKVHSNKWYHLWLTSSARNTISNANNKRSYKTYEELFYTMLHKCKQLDFNKKFDIDNPLYSLDASIIDLCLSMFTWAEYRKRKWAIKLHVLYNNDSSLPEFVNITEWKKHEVNEFERALQKVPAGSILTFDRWYVDYQNYNKITEKWIFFVWRTKKNMDYIVVEQYPVNEWWVISDQKIEIFNPWNKKYSELKGFRLIKYYDKEQDKTYSFITNNFKLSAKTIADIYKARWDVELFFKWIKQNLKIKSFLWTSKNTVMSQIWIAMIYYLILAYIKYKTKCKYSLLEFSRIIKELLMSRMSLIFALWIPYNKTQEVKNKDWPLQIGLF